MSKKKTPETENEVVDISTEQKDLHARIQELEAKILAGEQAALERVCKAMGVSTTEVTAKEAAAPKPERMIRLFVHYPVNVNGRVYKGDVTVPYPTFQVISQALGDRRTRLLRELTGNNYMLKELEAGVWAPTLVGKIDETGERIA